MEILIAIGIMVVIVFLFVFSIGKIEEIEQKYEDEHIERTGGENE